ncbi:MAG: hypothetical protein JNK20_15495 [Flavipsychrobacter sp.]|nr:hypothetical protein [Flavipsychrobacter sp.]
MTALDIAILIYSYAFSGLLIYLIDHGLEKRFQFIGVVLAIAIFLIYLVFSSHEQFSNLHYGFLTLPILAFLVFKFSGFVSWKVNNREFRATWRGARYFYTGKKNWLDHFLSFVVILTELIWPVFIAVILKG